MALRSGDTDSHVHSRHLRALRPASSPMVILPTSAPFPNLMSVKWHFILIYFFPITNEAENLACLLFICMSSSLKHLPLAIVHFLLGYFYGFVGILIFESFVSYTK